jgi:hypothetical protein
MKMHILIRRSVPTGFAVLASAHASLACFLKYRESSEVASWLAGPFYYQHFIGKSKSWMVGIDLFQRGY